jgi:hypothetical protein
MAGTVGAQANGAANASAAHAPQEAGAGMRPATVTLIRETRSWLDKRQRIKEAAAARQHLSTREWLARASFSLLAVSVVLAIVLAALGLLSGAETAGLLLPVVALTAMILGFFLGAESAGRREG